MADTVLCRYLMTVVETLAADYGVAPASLYARVGIAPLAQKGAADRVPFSDADALWLAAEALAGDQLLGLKVGSRMRYSSYASLGHMLVTSKTVGDSIRGACDFVQYVGAGGRFELVHDGALCRLIYRPIRLVYNAEFVRAEAALLPFVRFARWTTGGAAAATQVSLKRPRPSDVRAFEAAFGAPVKFAADCYAIQWPEAVLAQPMTDANPALHDMLRRHVEAEMPKGEALAARVRLWLMAGLTENGAFGGGNQLIAACAAQHGLSVRSFQRLLSADGWRFRDLLTDIRKTEAARLLDGSSLSIASIAEQLGYSEPAAFVRAFQRWYGLSPRAYWRRKNFRPQH